MRSKILDQAYLNHKAKGCTPLYRGMNFVECISHQFHIHIGKEEGPGYIHWYSTHDDVPVVSPNDSRLQPK